MASSPSRTTIRGLSRPLFFRTCWNIKISSSESSANKIDFAMVHHVTALFCRKATSFIRSRIFAEIVPEKMALFYRGGGGGIRRILRRKQGFSRNLRRDVPAPNAGGE